MNLLEKIIQVKRKYLYLKKDKFPIYYLEKSRFFNRKTYSLYKELSNNSMGIIAEFKRESPSKGNINNYNLSVENVVLSYNKAAVAGISILIDFPFFLGKEQDLIKAREKIQFPLLYKDIIIDEYQIILAKSIGSDIILLIAEVLSKKKIKTLIQTAKSLGLEILMELHSDKEIYKINEEHHIIGINNRDLKDFSIKKENSLELSKKITEKLKLSESGICDPYQITFFHKIGFNGLLIGEFFMRTEDPGKWCKFLINKN